MAALAGWLAVSTQAAIFSSDPFIDAGYNRCAVDWQSNPATNEMMRMTAGPDVVPGQPAKWAGIFDAAKDGYCLASFALLPAYVESPADIPQTTVMVAFDLPITQGLNYSMLHGCVSETVQIERGQTLGKVNGLPLIARVRLVCSSGALVRPGRVKGKLLCWSRRGLGVTAQPTEHILPASVFGGPPPAVGAYMRCPGMGTALLLSTVRRIVGEAKPMILLIGLRVRVVNLPAGTEILPWPRSVGRPRKAAEPPAPTDLPRQAIQTKAKRDKLQRDKVVALRRSYADPDNALIDPARRNKMHSASWRDPGDTDVLRRSPKVVSGFRSVDCLDTLLNAGTLTRAQVGAAKRLRRDYETGCLQTAGAVDWTKVYTASGGTPIGVSDRRLQFLERFQAAQKAVGRLFEVVDYICLQGGVLRDYAAQRQIHPANAAGRLFAAVELLQGHYDAIDENTERQRPVHTIGPQVGPQLEPSQPMAARQWAAD